MELTLTLNIEAVDIAIDDEKRIKELTNNWLCNIQGSNLEVFDKENEEEKIGEIIILEGEIK